MSELYHRDLVLWAQEQARLLRAQAGGRANEAPDWENVAEEIESLGLSQRRELASRIATILEHLIKLAASPAREPRPGWGHTVDRERDAIEDLLADSPSLRREIAELVQRQLSRVRARTVRELAGRGEKVVVDVNTLDFDETAVMSAPLRMDPI